MKFLKIALPSSVILLILAHYIFRKFFWCNVLLPYPGEPMGSGDLLEGLIVLLIAGLTTVCFLFSLLLFAVPKWRDKKAAVIILVFSLIPLPLMKYSPKIEVICNHDVTK